MTNKKIENDMNMGLFQFGRIEIVISNKGAKASLVLGGKMPDVEIMTAQECVVRSEQARKLFETTAHKLGLMLVEEATGARAIELDI